MAAAQNTYISIDKIAELKGLKSNRTLRIAINNEKYIARKIKVKGGYTYEILFSSLEQEIQEKLVGWAKPQGVPTNYEKVSTHMVSPRFAILLKI